MQHVKLEIKHFSLINIKKNTLFFFACFCKLPLNFWNIILLFKCERLLQSL